MINKYNNINFSILFIISIVIGNAVCLTASNETLLWRRLNKKSIQGISSIEEAFILVPADYEDENSPLIPVNIRRFKVNNVTNLSSESVNIWFIPGGPGQSSKSLEVMLPVFLMDLPGGSIIYAIDHRGLGKSTPMATAKEKELLEAFPRDTSLLPQIVLNQQRKLGILTPITRALRIENVARDLLTGVKLVKKEGEGPPSKHFLVGFSYGTMVARRALQIAPVGTFTGVLLDGLAPTEKIEQSNESDRILEEFCLKLPECTKMLEGINTANSVNSHINVRGIIPGILNNNHFQRNSCTNYFLSTFSSHTSIDHSLCSNLHEFMNAVWLTGRASVKVGGLRLMKGMAVCVDPEGFEALFNAVYEELLKGQSVNQLQSAAIVTNFNKNNNINNNNSSVNALTSDELVFEVISALERYDVTRSSMNICFNKKHSSNGDDPQMCPSRLFDPCMFFRMTWDRKQALKGIVDALPPISIKTPMVVAPETRIIVVSGNLDFNTPTWLSRQITAKYTKGSEVRYHEFFGYGHGIYGSSDCDREIFAELLNGSNGVEACARRWNEKNTMVINEYFKKSLLEFATFISKKS